MTRERLREMLGIKEEIVSHNGYPECDECAHCDSERCDDCEDADLFEEALAKAA